MQEKRSTNATLNKDYQLAGVKWIASMPDNVARGMERASAVMILNDRLTGRPRAVIEGSIISKQRTAASAALASKVLADKEPDIIGFVGCGPINIAVAQFLLKTWPNVNQCTAYDLDPARAEAFGDALNDLELLDLAGIGIAMAHSPKALRDIADDTFSDVASALQSIFSLKYPI